MRKGFNPNKDIVLKKSEYFHQIIIPVYIPHNKSYFKDSLRILKLCLESLFKTIHNRTFVTVVNNGSSEDVKELLESYYENQKVHELIHTTNIGKLNAIIKGVSGHDFELVTISDADVLFLSDWQKSTYVVFSAFDKTGFVSPCPSSKVLKKYTSNIHLENLFNKKLKFSKVKNPMALKKFATSIGNPDFYNANHLEQYLTIASNDIKAVVGGGHFIGTYKGEILRKNKTLYSEFALGGTSENLILDKPIEESGYWRLSTEDNYVYHMGNTFEDWMADESKNIVVDNENTWQKPILKPIKTLICFDWIKRFIFTKIVLRKPLWRVYLKYKGLDSKASRSY